MMNCFFNHTPLPFSGFSYWKKGFFNILLSLLFFTSCSNHHCKDPMFAPLEIGFYSDAGYTTNFVQFFGDTGY